MLQHSSDQSNKAEILENWRAEPGPPLHIHHTRSRLLLNPTVIPCPRAALAAAALLSGSDEIDFLSVKTSQRILGSHQLGPARREFVKSDCLLLTHNAHER